MRDTQPPVTLCSVSHSVKQPIINFVLKLNDDTKICWKFFNNKIFQIAANYSSIMNFQGWNYNAKIKFMNISIKNQIILPLCEKPKEIKDSNSSLLIAILQASRILFSFTGLDFFWTLHSSIVHTLLLWGRSKRASVIIQLQPLHP